MYIQIEETPNPNALKFLIDGLTEKQYEITKQEFTNNSNEFINKLFELEEIEKLFITSEFITVTKIVESKWEAIKPIIFQILLEAKMNPIIQSEEEEIDFENLDEISKQIVELLNERIKPAIHMDGGDITFIKFEPETGIVYVKLQGSCNGCPSATVTLQNGIKKTLQHYIPEVYDVAAVS